KNTPIHNMNTIAKMCVFMVLFIASTMVPNIWALIGICLANLIYALLAKFSFKKLALRTLKIVPWVLVFFFFQVFLFSNPEGSQVYWQWKFISISDYKLKNLARMLLHFMGAMTAISVFIYSIEQSELIDGLKKFSHTNTVIFFMLILRFIPLLTEELSHIVKIQIIREGIRSTRGFVNKVKAILPIIIPLTVQTIRRSTIIAEALEARGMK
nr:energy-coupling factor transporter transmembrane protein EcfT [Treponemataceae bacterium]